MDNINTDLIPVNKENVRVLKPIVVVNGREAPLKGKSTADQNQPDSKGSCDVSASTQITVSSQYWSMENSSQGKDVTSGSLLKPRFKYLWKDNGASHDSVQENVRVMRAPTSLPNPNPTQFQDQCTEYSKGVCNKNESTI
ncbi:uncharacterized protein LOC142335542 [Convolutriloba macropyga]|uniref:uncharacterized protein LOC142335542 n=1 Tax=Convolutriloba macropyga TaxID=536237 RepID=UPI003F52832F